VLEDYQVRIHHAITKHKIPKELIVFADETTAQLVPQVARTYKAGM
jgi:hypothetical protein